MTLLCISTNVGKASTPPPSCKDEFYCCKCINEKLYNYYALLPISQCYKHNLE